MRQGAHRRNDRAMVLARAIAVWAVLFAVEAAHGVARALLLTPLVGDLRARQIGVAVGAALILLVALATVRWIGAQSRRALWTVGLLWLALMIAAEVLLGRWLGLGWDRILEDFDPQRGGFLGFGMLFLTVSPLLASRLRGLTP